MKFFRSLIDKVFPGLVFPGLFLVVALLFASLFFAALVHRPMAQEGSWWYYEVLSTFAPMYDTAYFRHSDALFQIPTLLWLRLFPSNISVGIRLLDLCYGLHPILSLVATVLILKQRNRLDLVFFPLLAFATSTLSTIGFGLGIVPGALSAFWPLFFLVLLRRPGSKTDLIAIAALSLFLGFSHESAWFFFPVLAATSLWRRKILGIRNVEELAVFLLTLGFLGWYCYRFAFIWRHPNYGSFPPNPVGGVWDGLRQNLEGVRGFSYRITAALAASVAGFALFSKHQRKLRFLMAVFCIDSFCFFLLTFRWVDDPLYLSKLSRNSAIPVAGLIAIATLLLSERLRKLNWSQTTFAYAAHGWLLVALLVCGFGDFCATLHWVEASGSLRTLLEKKGCQTFFDKYERISYRYSLRHYTSILLQETWKPTSIVFFSGMPDSPFPPYDSCRTYSRTSHFGDAFIHSGTGQCFKLAPSHFDYSNLTPSLQPFYGKPLAPLAQRLPANFLASLPGLTLWLKADALKNVRSGSPVTALNDSSGASSLVLTPPDSNSAPTLINNAIGHMPALRFNGQGQALVAKNLNGTRLFSEEQSTLIFVLRASQQNAHAWFNWGDCDDNRFEVQAAKASDARLNFSMGPRSSSTTPGYLSVPLVDDTTSKSHILSFVRDKTQGYFFLDGIRISPLSWVGGKLELARSSTLTVGGGCEKNFFQGDLAEVIHFKKNLAPTTLKKVEGYLSTKYGIPLYE